MKIRIHKGDTVKVLKGKDKGKTGTVLRVIPKKNAVLVSEVNQYKRHVKKKAANQTSEIVTITKPLPVSSVILVEPTSKKTSKVGYSFMGGKKVRIAKKTGQEV